MLYQGKAFRLTREEDVLELRFDRPVGVKTNRQLVDHRIGIEIDRAEWILARSVT